MATLAQQGSIGTKTTLQYVTEYATREEPDYWYHDEVFEETERGMAIERKAALFDTDYIGRVVVETVTETRAVLTTP